MAKITELIKPLVFPDDVSYKIKKYEVLQPNDCHIDHLVDIDCDDVNPLMHILLTVELNGRKCNDEFYINSVAEFLKNKKIDYSFWNAKETQRRFKLQAQQIDLSIPNVTYQFLGHDVIDYLKSNEKTFRAYAKTDFDKQMDGFIPKREINFQMLKNHLEKYNQFK